MKTHRKSTAQTIEKPLAKEEWDFSNVPDDELETCFLVEYFRENPGLGVTNQKPFQCLSQSERRRIFADFRTRGGGALDQWFEVQPGKLVTARSQNMMLLLDESDKKIIGRFVIDWEFPDTEILRRFKIFLGFHRPHGKTPHKRGVKLNSVRVNLERLGIMRLLHHHSPKEIREKMPDAWKLLSQKEFFKERKHARETFEDMFPWVRGSGADKAIPLSWATKSGRSK